MKKDKELCLMSIDSRIFMAGRVDGPSFLPTPCACVAGLLAWQLEVPSARAFRLSFGYFKVSGEGHVG